MKKQVLVIVGPTAVGKTSLSIELAKVLGGEVISGDSLQVYKKLNIGTAKITSEEMEGIAHHLIDYKNIHDGYSASDFQKEGRKKIDEIISRGNLPIVVGGTGLYIQALLSNLTLGGGGVVLDGKLRAEIERFANDFGPGVTWERLNEIDPLAASKIHPNNTRRVVRAIEVMEGTGKSIIQEDKPQELLYDAMIIGLDTDRAVLYERINYRVDLMMTAGLLDEAQFVWERKDIQGAQGIGYKEFFPYFEGNLDLANAVELVKKNSRNYAKRQLTWFRNRMEVNWWDIVARPDDVSKVIDEVSQWYRLGKN